MAAVGSRISKSLGKLLRPTKSIIGCDGIVLSAHLESLFQPDQNWENYGTHWEMDHITPISAMTGLGARPTLTEKLARMHYTNLQPLTITAHRVKTWGERRPAGLMTDVEFDALIADMDLE